MATKTDYHGRIGEPEPASAAFRFMDASRDGLCHYCKEDLPRGAAIAGHYGILWGHQACVIGAWQLSELILSPNNREQRPLELETLANRRWHGNRVIPMSDAQLEVRGETNMVDSIFEMERLQRKMRDNGITIDTRTLERRVFEEGADRWPNLAAADAEAMKELAEKTGVPVVTSKQKPSLFRPSEKWKEEQRAKKAKKKTPLKQKLKPSETQLERPTSCSHFEPQLIEIVTMPVSMRPSKYVIEEFEACPETLEEILKRQWQKLLEERFAAYKAKQRVLPTCHYHEWMRAYVDKPVNVTVQVMDMAHQGFKWKRALWWACPGKE